MADVSGDRPVVLSESAVIVIAIMITVAIVIGIAALISSLTGNQKGDIASPIDLTVRGQLTVDGTSQFYGVVRNGVIGQVSSSVPLQAGNMVVVGLDGKTLVTAPSTVTNSNIPDPHMFVSTAGIDGPGRGFDSGAPLRTISAAIAALNSLGRFEYEPTWSGIAFIELMDTSYDFSSAEAMIASNFGGKPVIIGSNLTGVVQSTLTVQSVTIDALTGLQSFTTTVPITVLPSQSFARGNGSTAIPIANGAGANEVLLAGVISGLGIGDEVTVEAPAFELRLPSVELKVLPGIGDTITLQNMKVVPTAVGSSCIIGEPIEQGKVVISSCEWSAVSGLNTMDTQLNCDTTCFLSHFHVQLGFFAAGSSHSMMAVNGCAIIGSILGRFGNYGTGALSISKSLVGCTGHPLACDVTAAGGTVSADNVSFFVEGASPAVFGGSGSRVSLVECTLQSDQEAFNGVSTNISSNGCDFSATSLAIVTAGSTVSIANAVSGPGEISLLGSCMGILYQCPANIVGGNVTWLTGTVSISPAASTSVQTMVDLVSASSLSFSLPPP